MRRSRPLKKGGEIKKLFAALAVTTPFVIGITLLHNFQEGERLGEVGELRTIEVIRPNGAGFTSLASSEIKTYGLTLNLSGQNQEGESVDKDYYIYANDLFRTTDADATISFFDKNELPHPNPVIMAETIEMVGGFRTETINRFPSFIYELRLPEAGQTTQSDKALPEELNY